MAQCYHKFQGKVQIDPNLDWEPCRVWHRVELRQLLRSGRHLSERQFMPVHAPAVEAGRADWILRWGMYGRTIGRP